MNIEKDKVVQFNYTLSDASQKQLEQSDDKVPMAYLHGHGNLLSGLEKAMDGKKAGEKFSVTLEPSEAYGEIKDNAEQRIPVKHLQGANKWKKGMIGVVHTEEGRKQVTVVKSGKFMVTVDFNHPFAGKVLTFDIEVVDVSNQKDMQLLTQKMSGRTIDILINNAGILRDESLDSLNYEQMLEQY